MSLVTVLAILLFTVICVHSTLDDEITKLIKAHGLDSKQKTATDAETFDPKAGGIRYPIKYVFTDYMDEDTKHTVVAILYYDPAMGKKTWNIVIPPMEHVGDTPWMEDAANILYSNDLLGKEAWAFLWIASDNIGEVGWLSGSDKVGITGWGYNQGITLKAARMGTDLFQKLKVDVAKTQDAQQFPCVGLTISGKPKLSDVVADNSMVWGRNIRLFMGKQDCSIYEKAGFRYEWDFFPTETRNPKVIEYHALTKAILEYTVAGVLNEDAVKADGRKGDIKTELEGTGKTNLAEALSTYYGIVKGKVGLNCKKFHKLALDIWWASNAVPTGALAERSSLRRCDDEIAIENKKIGQLMSCWSQLTAKMELHGITSIDAAWYNAIAKEVTDAEYGEC